MVKSQLINFKIIWYFVGRVMLGIGIIQTIPLVTAFIYREWDIAINFIISISTALTFGSILMISCKGVNNKKLEWSHGMVITALSWFIGMILCALPYYLCGNYLSYLDACFDVMSGLTTTGLILIQDLDHVSNGVNMWRHLLTYVGGQGMVVLALTFLVKSTNGAYKMYVGEGKDEKLMPNAISTSKAIWIISILYLIIGTIALSISGICIGMKPDRAILHGMWIFMAGWSTGGFGPQSQNILYYHSAAYELITLIFFIMGSFNFALHYAVLTGKRKEVMRNIEILSMTITVSLTAVLTSIGLMRNNVYPNAMSAFRKGFYQLISGHTTTGFMTIYARQFYNEWGDLAILAIAVAMVIGGSACSTAGGFKGLRMGIIFKAFLQDVKRMILPESMVQIEKIHHIKDVILEDRQVRSAMLIVIMYTATFAIGTIAGTLYGYPLSSAAFESASVTGNVGLSIGVTSAIMPDGLKIIYIIIMWVARLEFMSVLALGAFMIYEVKRRWAN